MENPSQTGRGSPRRSKQINFRDLIGKTSRNRSSNNNESKVDIGLGNDKDKGGNKSKLDQGSPQVKTRAVDEDETKSKKISEKEKASEEEKGDRDEQEENISTTTKIKDHAATTANTAISNNNNNKKEVQEDKLQPTSSTSTSDDEKQIPSSSSSTITPTTSNNNNIPINSLGGVGIKEGRWTKEEHEGFLVGYEKHGKSWKDIALIVKTRTAEQIRTHAQKHFLRNNKQPLKSEKDMAQRQAEKNAKRGLDSSSTPSVSGGMPIASHPGPPGPYLPPPVHPHFAHHPHHPHHPHPPHPHPQYSARDRTTSLGDASAVSIHSAYSQGSHLGITHNPYYGYPKQANNNLSSRSRTSSIGDSSAGQEVASNNGTNNEEDDNDGNASDKHNNGTKGNNNNNGKNTITKAIGVENGSLLTHPQAHLNAGIYYPHHSGPYPSYGYNHMHNKQAIEKTAGIPTSGTSTPSTIAPQSIGPNGNYKVFVNDPNLNMITRTRKISDANHPLMNQSLNTQRDRSEYVSMHTPHRSENASSSLMTSELERDPMLHPPRSRKASDASFHFESSGFYDDDNFHVLRSRKNTITNIISNVNRSTTNSPAMRGIAEDPYMSGMSGMNLDGIDGSGTGSMNMDMDGRNAIGEVMKAMNDIQKMSEDDDQSPSVTKLGGLRDERGGFSGNNQNSKEKGGINQSPFQTYNINNNNNENEGERGELKKMSSFGKLHKLQNLGKLDKMESNLNLHALGNIQSSNSMKSSSLPQGSSTDSQGLTGGSVDDNSDISYNSNDNDNNNNNNNKGKGRQNNQDNESSNGNNNINENNNEGPDGKQGEDKESSTLNGPNPFKFSHCNTNTTRGPHNSSNSIINSKGGGSSGSGSGSGSALTASNNNNNLNNSNPSMTMLPNPSHHTTTKLPHTMRTIPFALLNGKFNAVGPSSGSNSGTATPNSGVGGPPLYPFPYPPYAYSNNTANQNGSNNSQSTPTLFPPGFKFNQHPISLLAGNPNALYPGGGGPRSRSNSINSNPAHHHHHILNHMASGHNRSRGESSVSSMGSAVSNYDRDRTNNKNRYSEKGVHTNAKSTTKSKKHKSSKSSKTTGGDAKNGKPIKEGRWIAAEHDLFLLGYQKYGKSWKNIAREYLPSRTPEQIRTHAQKYFQKCEKSGVTPVQAGNAVSRDDDENASKKKKQKKDHGSKENESEKTTATRREEEEDEDEEEEIEDDSNE